MSDYRINLTDTNSFTQAFSVGTSNRLSVQVEAGTWSTAVAELKWSLDLDQWDSFDPKIEFRSTSPGQRNVDVEAINYVRVETTTAASSATQNTEVTLLPFAAASESDRLPGRSRLSPSFGFDWNQLPAGMSSVSKFGRQPDVDTTSDPEDVWDINGTYTGFIAAADTIGVSSSDTDDTSGGTGARTIRLVGLDANYNPLEEDITLNGTSTVTTSGSFLRVFRMFVLTAGTTETNEGTITAVTTGGVAPTVATILPNTGQTLMAIYTVKAGVTAYVERIYAGLLNNTATAAEVWFQVKEEGAAWRTRFAIGIQSTGSGHVDHGYKPWLEIPAKADIRLRVQEVFANNTAVFGGFDLIMI